MGKKITHHAVVLLIGTMIPDIERILTAIFLLTRGFELGDSPRKGYLCMHISRSFV
jgi:hypothetical protein